MTNVTLAWMYGLLTSRTCRTPLHISTDKKSAFIHAISGLFIITYKAYFLARLENLSLHDANTIYATHHRFISKHLVLKRILRIFKLTEQ